MHKISKHRMRERGQSIVEYALILVLVATVVIVVGIVLGESVKDTYCDVVLSLDPGAEAPGCELVSVPCKVTSSPLSVEAVVNDTQGEDDIERVDFYKDGEWYNGEFEVKYCLAGGNDPCEKFDEPSGTYTITAIATDAEGNTGECTTKLVVP
jgi:Flp pilus assembly pilin Flp